MEIVRPDGSTTSVTHDGEKADALNQLFAEQTRLDGVPTTFPGLSNIYSDDSVADSIQTTPSEVFDCLTHLKPGKSPGLDELLPKLRCLCSGYSQQSV